MSLAQVPGALLDGVPAAALRCTGDREPRCSVLANALLDADGRRLPKLLRQNGLDPNSRIAIGAFSAGGSFVRRLLTHPADRAQVVAVHLADALYTSSWDDIHARVPPSIAAIAAYGSEAAEQHDKLLVATSSPAPNKHWATGVENIRRLRSDIERNVGATMDETLLPLTPEPLHAYRRGRCFLAEYPLAPLGHGHHKLAADVWQRIVAPQLLATAPPPLLPVAQGPPWWFGVLALGTGALWLMHRSSR